MTFPNTISFLTDGVKKLKIAVLGDVMQDRYVYGDVQRISPEAPVPVNRVERIQLVLGGAANVAANLAHLGCKAFVCGVTGDDSDRDSLDFLLTEAKIDASGLIRSPDRSTTTKMRIIGASQQMLRLDFEKSGDLTSDEACSILSHLRTLLVQGLDGVILSDYAKGVCSDCFCRDVINIAHEFSVPVLIDPKLSDWSKYTGCDYITPNMKELRLALGRNVPNDDESVATAASELADRFHIHHVVVTRSEKGMTLVNTSEKIVLHVNATARETFDVSGAGDTAAAVLIASLAGKLDRKTAITLANQAAGIVVTKVGTWPIHREELLKDVLSESRKNGTGFRPLTWDEIQGLVETWRISGEKVVFTNGCFDLLHVGHVSLLEHAAKFGRHLIVAINSDASVKRIKGAGRPIVNELDRAKMLASLTCVDAVVLFDQDTPIELLKRVLPDVLVKGGDYTPKQAVGWEWAKEVQIVPFEPGHSTTAIVEHIAQLVSEHQSQKKENNHE